MIKSPKVSVIIPTLNAQTLIGPLWEALQRQWLSPWETIIIDSTSDDKTADIASAFGSKVISIGRKDFNHGLTRNLGATLVSGDIIVFMTQDALPADDETLYHLIEPIVEGKAVAAYARQIPCDESDPIERFWRFHNYPEEAAIKNLQTTYRRYFFSNVCSAFRRDVFLELEGFEKAEIGEDMLMAYRLINARYSIAYQSSAQVLHSHHFTTREKIRRYFQIGAFNQAHPFLTAEASHEKDGIATVKKLFGYLLGSGEYRHLPIALADMTLRYLAYAAGRLSVSKVHPEVGSSPPRTVEL
ncbi:MAG: glycosyltransferase family 2 protein [Negativicutes bacterium]|nr:glycosyltransferase family 2 protein [Negativicutes bacterium]